jgi:Flp pilus assembly protein TadG
MAGRWLGSRWLVLRLRRVVATGEPERGAAVVEFALVSVLVLFLLFGVLQVAVYFYVHNIVAASAANGARYAASSDVDFAAGGPRAAQLMSKAAAASVARGVSCTGTPGSDPDSGLTVAVVTCRGKIRSIFVPLGALVTIDVRASALKEPAQ